jgi:hypothetical protein
MSYASKTQWSITASKIKCFEKDQLLYKLIYEDLIEIEDKQDKRCFVIWEAFHYLMEYWTDQFFTKYYIDEWLVKEKLLNKILEHHTDWSDDQVKESKKWLLPEVRAEYMKITNNEWKIELTPAEGRDLIWMYQSALSQPFRDMWWLYIKEHRFQAKYNWLNLSAQLDRWCVEDWNYERYNFEQVQDLLWGKDKSEQKQIISELWLTSHIRDFKTVWDISRLKSDMKWKPDSFAHGYITSMAFYYTIIYILFGLETTVYLDLIESSAPYPTDVLSIPSSTLTQKIPKIKGILDSIIKCKESWEYSTRSREERIEDREAIPYIQYHPEYKQTSPSFIEFDF